jgi:DNA-binding MarR family transcriptional regulator
MIDGSPAGGQDGRMADTRYLRRMLLEAFRVVDAQVNEALEARGASDLSPRRATAILLIDKKGVRLTDLAARAGITKQAMMQVVNDLDRMGLVIRAPDVRDARAKMVRLTTRGQAERAEAAKAVAAAEQRIRRKLGAARYDALRRSLASIVA